MRTLRSVIWGAIYRRTTKAGTTTAQGTARKRSRRRGVPKRYLNDVPNPYEVGQREVLNYFAVVELCTKAAKVRATGAL